MQDLGTQIWFWDRFQKEVKAKGFKVELKQKEVSTAAGQSFQGGVVAEEVCTAASCRVVRRCQAIIVSDALMRILSIDAGQAYRGIGQAQHRR